MSHYSKMVHALERAQQSKSTTKLFEFDDQVFTLETLTFGNPNDLELLNFLRDAKPGDTYGVSVGSFVTCIGNYSEKFSCRLR